MQHDFIQSHLDRGCDHTGFMSYGEHPDEWSECSKTDLLALYNQVENFKKKDWCLPGKLHLTFFIPSLLRPWSYKTYTFRILNQLLWLTTLTIKTFGDCLYYHYYYYHCKFKLK